ncbi:MAG: TIGR04283 family arsenosugar biosynthesis glycosyltransferase [Candidatus Latescibacteria bacterium]|nr:TIGR04283 family arsenosugar biosynthesis glycosyltransferase [Candidatus Latescibacterota bacterium]
MMTRSLRISVIIPTLNEEQTIATCLRQFQDGTPHEVIVVDGASTDRTVEAARHHSFVRVIQSPHYGRAVQMNLGAAEATGELLVFLHADTFLPARWQDAMLASIQQDGAVGGRFRLRLAEPGLAYRCIAWGTNFRSRVLGITYGDQVIYARREAFQRVGGFPLIPLFEDSEFCRRLRREGRFAWIDQPVITSARRWKVRGVMRTVLLMWLLRTLYTLSVPPDTLARYYGAVR